MTSKASPITKGEAAFVLSILAIKNTLMTRKNEVMISSLPLNEAIIDASSNVKPWPEICFARRFLKEFNIRLKSKMTPATIVEPIIHFRINFEFSFVSILARRINPSTP